MILNTSQHFQAWQQTRQSCHVHLQPTLEVHMHLQLCSRCTPPTNPQACMKIAMHSNNHIQQTLSVPQHVEFKTEAQHIASRIGRCERAASHQGNHIVQARAYLVLPQPHSITTTHAYLKNVASTIARSTQNRHNIPRNKLQLTSLCLLLKVYAVTWTRRQLSSALHAASDDVASTTHVQV